MSNFYDEMYSTAATVRPHYQAFADWLAQQPPHLIDQKRAEAELNFQRVGITFAVYGDNAGTERLIPFDIIPRVINAAEWARLQAGLVQRVTALNRFLHDVYHDQNILKAGVIPAEQILNNAQYRPAMQGVKVPLDIYAHIAGVDIVRAGEGEFYVLEDNLRVPSGVSYMLEDRKMMMRLFPALFASNRVAPVDHYPDLLLDNLRTVAPHGVDDPTVVVLTPGMHNSAYFEHAFLAQQMGVELVQGQGPVCQQRHRLHAHDARPEAGRRHLSPHRRRLPRSAGVPSRFDAGRAGPARRVYRAGRVTLANAIGTGVADDKSIYPFVPDMIKFYLGEKPILNNVPTYQCRKKERPGLHAGELAATGGQGSAWRGRLRHAGRTGLDDGADRRLPPRLLANPDGYIAQPTLALSACPTYVESGIAPRHIDLRPFVLSGKSVSMVPGGLTRVALQEGSLVVNSSQGGGTKDTWILEN